MTAYLQHSATSTTHQFVRWLFQVYGILTARVLGLDFVDLVSRFITIGDTAKQTAGNVAKEAATVAK